MVERFCSALAKHMIHVPVLAHPNSWLQPRRRRLIAGLFVLVLALSLAGCAPPPNDEPIPPDVLRTIENKGSDTMVNLALAWAETYMDLRPDVRISVTGGGSGTGIASLINGTVDIVGASRAIEPVEVEAAEMRGITPVEFTVARDAIAVIVHPDNPVDDLTFQQLSDIFTGRITNWEELGWERRPIVLVSRESNSGTYMYFLATVIRMGDEESDLLFSPDALLMPSSEGITAEVSQNPNAIGYEGLGYVTPHEKTVAVARDAEGPFVLPSQATVVDGTYPIARPLYFYTAGAPTGVIAAYLDWVIDEGQHIVSELGFVPIQ